MIFELAHHMAAVPFLWLAWLHRQGKTRGAEWWWLAAAFFVSWVADTAAHWMDQDLVGNLYPVSQAAIVGAVLLYRRDALILLGALTVTALMVVAWRGPLVVDVLLRTVAWGAIIALAYDYEALGRLRVALLVYFGLGLLAWWGYAAASGWWSWGIYQSVRMSGLMAFCWASMHPGPTLRLAAR